MFYIDDTEDLIVLCEEIKRTTNIVAIDTEFNKQNEYFPTLSIIQVSFFNGDIMRGSVIDVLSPTLDLQPFFEILNSREIKKVFHSCSQDLEALYYISKKVPVAVEDTQVMAEFCGMKSNMSYVDLIKETTGVIIKKEKKLQAGNWMKRPLTEEQLNYALGDVDYLLEAYIILVQKLDKNRNFKYYRMDIEERYGLNMMENLIKHSWRKMRFKLGNRTMLYMEAMKEMCAVREQEAMNHNIIKNLVMPDVFLRKLLSEQPKTIEEINVIFEDDKDIVGKSKVLKKKFIKAYSNVLNKAKIKNLQDKPYIIELKDKVAVQKFEEITDYIISECKKMNINPELVQNKCDISSYLSCSEELENVFEEWKIELFGKRFKEIRDR